MKSEKIKIDEKFNWHEWTKWKEWDNKKRGNYNPILNETKPGIYLLAITPNELSGKPKDYSQVSYIGMTNSKGGITQRLNQFDSSIRGKKGHSGGNGIYNGFKLKKEKIARLGHYKNWKEKHELNLYVSYHIVNCGEVNKEERTPEDLIQMGKCAYLEYKAMAEYKKQMNNKEPVYNKK